MELEYIVILIQLLHILYYSDLFGISLYGQREIAYAQNQPKKRKKVFLELIIIRFVTVAIAAVVYYIWFAIGDNEFNLYYKILIIELIAAAFDISWFFQGIEEFKKTVIRNVLVRVISVTLVFVFVKTSEDLWKYILIYSLRRFFRKSFIMVLFA